MISLKIPTVLQLCPGGTQLGLENCDQCNSLTDKDWRNSVQLCPEGCNGQGQIYSANVQMWSLIRHDEKYKM